MAEPIEEAASAEEPEEPETDEPAIDPELLALEAELAVLAETEVEFQTARVHGLAWLLCHQHPDGRWSTWNFTERCQAPGCDEWLEGHRPKTDVRSTDIATTAITISAFTRAGVTHRDGVIPARVAALEKARKWLVDQQQESGVFGDPAVDGGLDHVIAALALSELLHLSRDRFLLTGPVRKATRYIYDTLLPELLAAEAGDGAPDVYAVHFLVQLVRGRWLDDQLERGRDKKTHPEWREDRERARLALLGGIEKLAKEIVADREDLEDAVFLAAAWTALLEGKCDDGVTLWRDWLYGRPPPANSFQWYLPDPIFAIAALWISADFDWPAEITERFVDPNQRIASGCDRGSTLISRGVLQTDWLISRPVSTALHARRFMYVYYRADRLNWKLRIRIETEKQKQKR